MERRRVEEEISALYLQISTLQSYLNTFSPVAKLPPEILSEIFLTVRENQILGGIRPNAWVVVTSVCRQWRSIALRTATLWTEVDLSRAEWMNLLLERSQSAPLSLVASNVHKVTPEVVEVALRNIHRFSYVDTPFVTETILEPQTLPLLNEISLGPPHHKLADVPSMMTSVFDQCEFPNLHILSLFGFTLNPSSPMFASSLKELTIDDASFFTIPMLVDILSMTPALELFYLSSDVSEIGSGLICLLFLQTRKSTYLLSSPWICLCRMS